MLCLLAGFFFFPASYIIVRVILKRLGPHLSKADHSVISEKCVSSLQAIMSTIVGVIIAKKCQANFMDDSHFLTCLYAEFALPYFVYDMFAMYFTYTDTMDETDKDHRDKPLSYRILHYLRNNKPMVFHHILLPGLLYPVIIFFRGGRGDFVVGVLYCIEATIPFISLRFILAQLNKKDTAAYIISGLLMIATFFVCRILVFPYIYWRYAIYAGLELFEVPLRIPFYCNLGCLSIFVLQAYWFGLMIRGACKVFYKIYKIKYGKKS